MFYKFWWKMVQDWDGDGGALKLRGRGGAFIEIWKVESLQHENLETATCSFCPVAERRVTPV